MTGYPQPFYRLGHPGYQGAFIFKQDIQGAVELKKWISSTGRGRKSPMLQRKKNFQNKLINMYIK